MSDEKKYEYNEALDVLLCERKVMTGEKSAVLIGLYSYNGGNPKIGFSKWFMKKDGTEGTQKGGRIPLDAFMDIFNAVDAMKAEIEIKAGLNGK